MALGERELGKQEQQMGGSWSFSCTGVELGGQCLIQSSSLCLNLGEGSMFTRLRRD